MYRYIFILLSSSLLWSLEGPPPVTEKHDGLDRSVARKFKVLSEGNDNSVRIKLVDDEDSREYHVNLTSVMQYRHWLHGDILQRRGLLPDPTTFDKKNILNGIENAIAAQRYMTVRHLVPHAYRIDKSYKFRDALKDLLQHYADEGHPICAFEYARVRLRDLNRTRPPYVQKDGLLRVPTEFACVLFDHNKYLALGLVSLQVNALQCFHPDAIPPLKSPPGVHLTPQIDWLDEYKPYLAASRTCEPLHMGIALQHYFETFIQNTGPLVALEHIQSLCQELLEGTKILPSLTWVRTENPNLQTGYDGPFTAAHYVALFRMIADIKKELIPEDNS